MVNVLIVYASTHGHTAKICRRIADVLQSDNLDVDLVDLGADNTADPHLHDGVIVAASIHRGTHQHGMTRWVRRHREALSERPTAFVSVSLAAAEDTDESREFTEGALRDFTVEAGWSPDRSISIAGALQYREYDFFTRTLMRLLMRRGGHPTDTSRDYEYTDWDAVAQFARDFDTLVASRVADETVDD